MSDNDTTVFKCRKCRYTIFTGSSVITCHGEPNTDFQTLYASCDSLRSENIWYLKEENFGDWIQEQLNNGEWIKGKILCPKCNCRIGSFDFVTGALCPCKQFVLPPVHIIKRKVDCQSTKKLPLVCSITVPEKYHNEMQVVEFPHEYQTSAESPGSNSSDISIKNRRGNSKMGNDGMEDLKQEYSDSNVLETKETEFKSVITHGNNITENNYMLKNDDAKLLSIENGLNPRDGFENFLCPICLDLFLCPFTCQPCGHVFCEMCLRRIAKWKPTHTNCPICRQVISKCELNREVSSKVKSLFPEEHNVRLKEGNRDSQYSPLPWNPHSRCGLRTVFGVNPNNDDEMEQSSIWSIFSSQQRTFTMLLSLKILSASMFFIGYFGGASLTSAIEYIFSFLCFDQETVSNE